MEKIDTVCRRDHIIIAESIEQTANIQKEHVDLVCKYAELSIKYAKLCDDYDELCNNHKEYGKENSIVVDEVMLPPIGSRIIEFVQR